MTAEVTFILATKNRGELVKRAIDSCLACENYLTKVHVIVIDGSSNDETLRFLKDIYSLDQRVELIQNITDDFMNTCFQGVTLAKTQYATFMYDDDVLSPYFKDMIDYMLDKNKLFIMGYGMIYNVEEIYPFKPINKYIEYNKLDLLLGYFGRTEHLDFTGLPCSPICCMVTTDTLQAWVSHLISFVQGNKIKEYFMMKRNIGPDLMIYLSAILQENKTIAVAPAIVAQFSTHASSMSITYGQLDLDIGYWLAKIWAFQQVCKAGYRLEAAACSAYLLTFGVLLIFRKMRRRELSWVKSICFELAEVGYRSLNEGLGISTLIAFVRLINNRLRLSQKVFPL
jgi:hypothetical protein